MVQRILIDAVHPDEIRVAVADDNKLQEFDFENVAKKQIKGNIYLGKITRVEPSLQAAFVEYGGNRQGFLPFSEVHFDYFQIPVADKERILAELAAQEVSEPEDDLEEVEDISDAEGAEEETKTKEMTVAAEVAVDDAVQTVMDFPEETGLPVITVDPLADLDVLKDKAPSAKEIVQLEASAQKAKEEALDSVFERNKNAKKKRNLASTSKLREGDETSYRVIDGTRVSEVIEGDDKIYEGEELGGDEIEDVRISRNGFYREYKIQEVLKRNQIVLIQVIKEERGNKGASLTTYISLAGRYGVLMPNTDRAGGVSRRISDVKERKRLKSIISGLDVDKGASVIMRTAGVEQTEADIIKDYSYLKNLWSSIRQNAVNSSAPALVHEEGNIIKRSLRDLYRSNISEVVIEGVDAYKNAKRFIDGLSKDKSKNIKEHSGKKPIFIEYGIDEQLDELYDNEAKLKSGGSIVITPTEALVSIDVNSGKATKEKSIEDTALKTNIEAAYEVARQLRLRDLAGLVVIDFIDMREQKNRRAVERALKDALKTDRAKIQVGRISVFGLLEMSRQRMRSSIVEASTQTCPRCQGTGLIRSEVSASVKLIRAIVGEAKRDDVSEVKLRTSMQSAIMLLNTKRKELSEIEDEYEIKVLVEGDPELVGSAFVIEKQRARNMPRRNSSNKSSGAEEVEHIEEKEDSNTRKPSRTPRGRKPSHKNADAPEKGKRRGRKPVSDDVGNVADNSGDNVGNDSIGNMIVEEEKKANRPHKRKPTRTKAGDAPEEGDIKIANNDASRPSDFGSDKEQSRLRGIWEKMTQ